jgi:hypothetical protein
MSRHNLFRIPITNHANTIKERVIKLAGRTNGTEAAHHGTVGLFDVACLHDRFLCLINSSVPRIYSFTGKYFQRFTSTASWNNARPVTV